MVPADLADVMAVAAVVHPDYPEDREVFAERLALAPEGCRTLCDDDGIAGYALSHPWPGGEIPALNSLLGAIPVEARSWYLHDLALLPRARGSGAGGRLVAELVHLARARGFAGMALVAVNGSAGFWRRQGFHATHDAPLDRRLASYDNAARYMQRGLEP